MRCCQMINQVDELPEQCRDCRFREQYVELACIKKDPCKSRVPAQDPDLLEDLRLR